MCACIGNASCSNTFSLHCTPCLGHRASQGLMSFSIVATVIVTTMSGLLLSPYPYTASCPTVSPVSRLVRLGLSACSASVFPCSSSSRARSSCSCRRRANSPSEKSLSGQPLACIVRVGRVGSSRPYLSSPRPLTSGSPALSSTCQRIFC